MKAALSSNNDVIEPSLEIFKTKMVLDPNSINILFRDLIYHNVCVYFGTRAAEASEKEIPK